MIRVTTSMLSEQSLANLQLSLRRVAEVRDELSTGRVLNRPSDDPAGTAAAMRLRSQTQALQQTVRNIDDGAGWLSQTDSALSSLTNSTRRARELALQGANTATMSPETRGALAAEVHQIREACLGFANARYLSRPVFGGTTPGTAAYDSSGAYCGLASPVNRVVSEGTSVRVDTDAQVTFGPAGNNLFDRLARLETALRNGDGAGVTAAVDSLKESLDMLSTAQADVGARALRLDRSRTAADEALDTASKSLSTIENTDLPAAIVSLQMAEVAYQSALGVTAKTVQPSLLDFLR